jgi:NAD dependent epimerase/dehydratase family
VALHPRVPAFKCNYDAREIENKASTGSQGRPADSVPRVRYHHKPTPSSQTGFTLQSRGGDERSRLDVFSRDGSRNQLHGAAEVLEACCKVNPGIAIVHAGTWQIYGRPEYLPVDECHPLRPVDVRGVNTVAGEAYHLMFREVYGIRTPSLRPPTCTGRECGPRIRAGPLTALAAPAG